jgi:SAM-dependent methyltransferase
MIISQIKQILKLASKALRKLGFDINISLENGVSAFGYNLSLSKHRVDTRGFGALNKCIQLSHRTVLDVGSGGGEHAKFFQEANAKVTCIDFGTSVYAINSEQYNSETMEIINIDFLKWNSTKQYDIVWASHILEHQRNVGLFIEKLVKCCRSDGHIAITVPFPHRNLWGGHLSQWTPGLLAYNCVLCGLDLANATLLYGYRETSIIFKPVKIELPELSYDSGDLIKLKPFLPNGFTENSDGWI